MTVHVSLECSIKKGLVVQYVMDRILYNQKGAYCLNLTKHKSILFNVIYKFTYQKAY